MKAVANAAQATIIEVPARGPVQRSGRGRLSSDADRQPAWFVDLDHLPGQAVPQIALRTIHDAKERRDVVRKLRAAAVSGRIDIAEVVLEADPRDDWHDGGHDARQDRAIVVARW